MGEMQAPDSQFLVYADADGRLKIDVRLDDDTVWLTQQGLAELFQTTKQNVSAHIQNVYDEGELDADRTVKDHLTVRNEGGRSVRRNLPHYNHDMIIPVGYRVKSHVATRFRIWATERSMTNARSARAIRLTTSVGRCSVSRQSWVTPEG